MLINGFDNKKIALIFSHYAYRNTKVEDLHAGKSVIMDKIVYDKVYKIVKKKINSIKRNHHLVLMINNDDELKNKLEATSPVRALEIIKYFSEMLSYSMFPCGTNWDQPILLDEQVDKDLAKYVLSGAFLDCCLKHFLMDDKTMCCINKDIYNRFYTLVCYGLL